MPALYVHLANAAFGPWGLVVGAGAAVAIVASRRSRGARRGNEKGSLHVVEPGEEGPIEYPFGQEQRPHGVSGERASTTLALVSEWWEDLVAEVRAQWNAGRADESAGLDAERPAPTPRRRARPHRPSQPRRRGPNGRFAPRTEEPAD
ncbi:MAG: hypothetical protein HW416_1040 [Chloroflexi bacterium]|nr:hypothetical protein [Chloroflexota bacterium]